MDAAVSGLLAAANDKGKRLLAPPRIDQGGIRPTGPASGASDPVGEAVWRRKRSRRAGSGRLIEDGDQNTALFGCGEAASFTGDCGSQPLHQDDGVEPK